MSDTDNKLRVTSVQIRDVLGIRELAMEPKGVTVISGRNGSGKSTVLESIKSVVKGGNLANLQRIGDEGEEIKPEVVLVLDSDTEQYRIEKKGKTTRVRKRVGDSAGFEDIPAPARWLSSLFDGKMANPIDFLNAKDKKDRILILLGALNVQLDSEALWSAMGIEKDEAGFIPEGLHPLQELALIRDGVFTTRTGVNRDKVQKESSAEQTRRAAPAVLPDSHDDEIAAMEKTLSARDIEIAEEMEKAKSECDLKCSEAISDAKAAIQKESDNHNQWHVDRTTKHNQWADEKLAKLEDEITKQRIELHALIKEDENKLHALVKKNEKETTLKVEKYKETRDALKDGFQKVRDEKIANAFEGQRALESDRTKLTEMREQAKSAIRAQTLHEQAEQFDKDAEDLQKRSKKLTDAINALDSYRASLTKDLPIQGLEVDDKEIKVDGVPFDQLNTAKRMEIAVQIACIRSKDQRLPIVWVDGAEALDDVSFAAMKAELEKQGCQPFVAKVSNNDLEF